MDLEQRNFRADSAKLKRLRVAAGLTVKDVTKQTGLDRTTVRKLLGGEPVFLSTLKYACETVFQIDNPLDVLHPEELSELGVRTDVDSPDAVLEWTIEKHLSPWLETANGLQYQLLQLRHRFLDGRLARGKCYELRHLTTAEQQRLEGHLKRHVEVCEQIGAHPNITDNLTAASVRGLWWVLDRWEEGETLANRLGEGPLNEYALWFVMQGIAEGLAALHAAGIIQRELSPQFVLLRQREDRPILMDFELAKIADGRSTVAPDQWPVDPYRAIEVTGNGSIDCRADLYSWGRIFVHAATGALPEPGEEDLSRTEVPESVRQMVMKCVAVGRSQRPADTKTLLKILKAWR